MWNYLSLLPVILALWAIAGIWIVNCGSYAPQSCIFGQILNTGAALAVWICIVRYHQLRDWGVKTWQNQLILWSGILCAVGTSIVGNFQVRCNLGDPPPETGLHFPTFPKASSGFFCVLGSQGFLGFVVLATLAL